MLKRRRSTTSQESSEKNTKIPRRSGRLKATSAKSTATRKNMALTKVFRKADAAPPVNATGHTKPSLIPIPKRVKAFSKHVKEGAPPFPPRRNPIQFRINILLDILAEIEPCIYNKIYLIGHAQRNGLLNGSHPSTSLWAHDAQMANRVFHQVLKRIEMAGEQPDIEQVKVWEERVGWLMAEVRTYAEEMWENGDWDDNVKEGVFKKGWNWGQASRTKKRRVSIEVDPLNDNKDWREVY